MGNKNFNRRNFFRKLTASPTPDLPDNDDPLFQKYSRKKLGTRRYSTKMVELNAGTEDQNGLQREGSPVTSGLAPYSGTWGEEEALHLLRRTNFGWKKAWVDLLAAPGMTASAAVDAVLNVSATPPPPPVNWYQNTAGNADESALAGNNNATDNPVIGYGADWTAHYFPTTATGQTTNVRRMEGLRRWLFGLTLNGDHTIREKMVWFWFHLIPIDFETIYQSSNSYVSTNTARILYRYMKMFRDNALGNFKSLMKEVSLSPAMMFYLNNQANSVTAPDENYGRELMELFTMGKNPLRYTEDDVKAAARVLTGWRVGATAGTALNTANVATTMVTANTSGTRKHDPNPKVFSAFFGNATIASSTTNTAVWAGELDQLLNLIFGPAQAETVSQYICRRLYRYFVYYDIPGTELDSLGGNVEANVIAPLAQTLVANNWDIKPVLAQLFKSQHFFDAANRGCYIKSPFDLVAGLLNSFNVNTTDANIEYQYRIWSKYNDSYCLSMEQQMGSIPNVSGWNAFYQTPAYHQYWINSNSIQKRFVFIRDTISSNHTISGVFSSGTTLRRFAADTVAFAQQFGNAIAADPNALIATSIRYLLPVDITPTQKDDLKRRTLLYQQSTDGYWTTAWNTYIADPTNTTKRKTVEDRLKNLYTEICQWAEYQLM